MLRVTVHNLLTDQRYEFQEATAQAVEDRLARKAAVYGQPERRLPRRVVHATGGGYRIEERDGDLVLVIFVVVDGHDQDVSVQLLSTAHPEWYAAGRTPTLDGDDVVIPPERVVQITDVTADENRKLAIEAVQARLDTYAQSWGYDNIFTACTYADELSVPKFQAEGQVLRAWRSATWAAVEANQHVATLEALMAALPDPPERPV